MAWLVRFLVVALLIHPGETTTYSCNPTTSCGCTQNPTVNVNARVVGGETAPSGTWGWMASLRFGSSHRCGAAIISSEYIVTAAHCVDDINSSNMRSLSVLAGTNLRTGFDSNTAQTRTVLAVRSHPSFVSGNSRYDIAIIRVSPFRFGSDSPLRIICLPNADQDVFTTGDSLVAIGWGRLTEGSVGLPVQLQQVTVSAMATGSADCVRAPILDGSSQICAGLPQGGKGKTRSNCFPCYMDA
jgi:secreted trypsin-like serine protease